jgi:hypothetical protein
MDGKPMMEPSLVPSFCEYAMKRENRLRRFLSAWFPTVRVLISGILPPYPLKKSDGIKSHRRGGRGAGDIAEASQTAMVLFLPDLRSNCG